MNAYSQNELESIKWMLNRSTQNLYEEKQTMPYYGDLTELNTDRTIQDYVGKDTLKKIAIDAIDLLETSIAIYEKNGDYAVGIFSSGWCQTLDSASRRRCGKVSNEEALNCGKWICHENCWNVSKRALESGKVVDESCVGDLALYAIPIFAFGEAIGVVSVGYGNPPDDEKSIEKLSKIFQISQETLLKQSRVYQKRPAYIVKMAKKKMHTSAELIGLIVETKMAAEKLKDQREELQAQNQEITAMNEALKKSEEQAKEASRAKSDFLANMSHEIRTPLSGILGFGELLQVTPLKKNQQQFLETIINCSYSLMDIINDILDLSKIEAGKLELNPEKTNLKALLKAAVDVITYQAESKGLEVLESISRSIPALVEVDDIRLKQILLNLLNNAVKFTDKGTIELKVKRQSIDKDKQQVTLLFSVKDTGIGIKQENLKKIFKEFHQENMSTTKKYGGTGLGLSISNQLLKKMGSQLKVSSQEGVGSEFSFELNMPYYEEKEMGTETDYNKAPSIKKEEAIKESHKVLIVDDNETILDYVKKVLATCSERIHVVEARNGIEGYKQFKAEEPDLIFMDIVMPGSDGYQATAMIRQEDQRVPIIALTAKALQGEKEECLNAGMDDYLSKPVSLKRLKEMLKKYL